MAERMNDENNQSDVQGSTPRGELVVPVLHVVCHAWMAWVAMVPIVIQAYIIYKVSRCKKFRIYIPLFKKFDKHLFLDTETFK